MDGAPPPSLADLTYTPPLNWVHIADQLCTSGLVCSFFLLHSFVQFCRRKLLTYWRLYNVQILYEQDIKFHIFSISHGTYILDGNLEPLAHFERKEIFKNEFQITAVDIKQMTFCSYKSAHLFMSCYLI